MNTNNTIKLIMMGDTSVGSGSIIDDYLHNKNNTESEKAKFEYKYKMRDDGTIVKMMVWDSWGDDEFRKFTKKYYRDADGFFLVYDVSKKESFDNVDIWINDIRKYHKNNNNFIVLVGNETDKSKSRKISVEQGIQKAHDLGLLTFIETTTKKSNIEEVFDVLIKKIVEVNNIKSQSKIEITKRMRKDAGEIDLCCGCVIL